jgi:diguanylate cyclase (GGDEF)-like protein
VADKRLLLVAAPDAHELQRDLESTLTRDPIEVCTADDGVDALRLAVELRPDVIVLDLAMAGLLRDEVFQTLQDDPVLSEIPLVCIAATAADEAVRALRRHEYLTRPMEVDALASRVSAAIVIKSLRDTLREDLARIDLASRTDYLTGLWNRNHVTEQLPAIAAGARRQRLPLAVVVVEVDHLGSINSTHGESGGNDVLRHLGSRLRETARIEDVCGRWADEQLIAVLPATDLDGAWRLGERLRVAVLERPFPLREGGDAQVTVSVGCSASDHADPDGIVRAAEAALKAARESGRNQVRAEPA